MGLERRKIDRTRIPDTAAHKWSLEVLEEGFVPFPKKLIRCLAEMFGGPDGIDQLRVLLAVIDYRRPDLVRPPSLEYLSFNAGMMTATRDNDRKSFVTARVGCRDWKSVQRRSSSPVRGRRERVSRRAAGEEFSRCWT